MMNTDLSPQYVAQIVQDYPFDPTSRKQTGYDRSRPWNQTCSETPVIDRGEKKEIWEGEEAFSSDAESNEPGIDVAIDLRVALFFQQAILCYKMPFHFGCDEANDQYGVAKQNIDTPRGVIPCPRQAAHPSTIPGLYAYPKQDWENYDQARAINPNAPKPRAFTYLKGSYTYLQNNATIGMSRFVNQADICIDGDGKDGKLRTQALRLTNLVAEGLDPVEATKQFLEKFDEEATNQIRRQPKNDPRRKVLKVYRRSIREMQQASANPVFFDRLLGVIIATDHPKVDVLRKVVFEKRFAIVRLGAAIESRIAKKLEIFKQSFATNQKNYAELALLTRSTNQERVILEKLFGKTMAVLENEYVQSFSPREVAGKTVEVIKSEYFQNFNLETFLGLKRKLSPKEEQALQDKTLEEILQGVGAVENNAYLQSLSKKKMEQCRRFQTTLRNLSSRKATELDNFLRDLRKDFKDMFDAERTFRSGLFKDLRQKVNHWIQKDFAEEHKALFPNKPMSAPTVSRLEQRVRPSTKAVYQTPLNQRRKDITVDDALGYAETFGVDAGLFLPALFASDS